VVVEEEAGNLQYRVCKSMVSYRLDAPRVKYTGKGIGAEFLKTVDQGIAQSLGPKRI
jgi:hypothetical protein